MSSDPAVFRGSWAPLGLLFAASFLCGAGCSGNPICDGSSGVRLSFRSIGGGNVVPGSQVLSENGFDFLVVDGQCHFWARPDEWSDVREGDLTQAQSDGLSDALALPQWSRLQGDYSQNLCDGATREYRFAGEKITVYSDCGGGRYTGPITFLSNASVSQLAAIYATGTPVEGPVRLVLVFESADAFWPQWWIDHAAQWPSASDPSAIALTYDQASNYQSGSSVLVMPPDADALRAARRSFVEQNGPQLTGGLLPLLGPVDEKYDSFIRDSISLEDSQGLMHLD